MANGQNAFDQASSTFSFSSRLWDVRHSDLLHTQSAATALRYENAALSVAVCPPLCLIRYSINLRKGAHLDPFTYRTFVRHAHRDSPQRDYCRMKLCT